MKSPISSLEPSSRSSSVSIFVWQKDLDLWRSALPWKRPEGAGFQEGRLWLRYRADRTGTHPSGGLWVLLLGGDLRPGQAASPLHPDRRGFVGGAFVALGGGSGHRARRGRGAEEAPRAAADHGLRRNHAAVTLTRSLLAEGSEQESDLPDRRRRRPPGER